jgi:hypothetical protein
MNSERNDTYMDLSVDVADSKTIEEALANFIKAETLTGTITACHGLIIVTSIT